MKALRNSNSLGFRGVATIATAIGAVAVGAFAVGAFAMGRLAIRRLWWRVPNSSLSKLRI